MNTNVLPQDYASVVNYVSGKDFSAIIQPVAINNNMADEQLDNAIRQHENNMNQMYRNGVSNDIKTEMVRAIIKVSIRYHPERTNLEFVDDIVLKAYKCKYGWNSEINMEPNDMIAVYDSLLNGDSIEAVLENFSYDTLCVYGI